MSKISCDIIQDMLPLYYDEVCSADRSICRNVKSVPIFFRS